MRTGLRVVNNVPVLKRRLVDAKTALCGVDEAQSR